MPVELNRFLEDAAEDARFLEGIRNRDRDSMMALYDRYSNLIFAVALWVLQRPDEAEDVMQDILLKLWCGSISFVPGRAPLGVWLIVVTRRHAIDVTHKRRLSGPVQEMTLPSSSSVAQQVEAGIEVAGTQDVVAKLPISQQESLFRCP
jgi:DNA-directed RNA polymerase specialized sigma24 family protein